MAKTISATEAARNFSTLLNRVSFRGERYTIARGGKPLALLMPAAPATPRTLGELPDLLNGLPPLGKDAGPFAHDVARATRKAPALPRKSLWA